MGNISRGRNRTNGTEDRTVDELIRETPELELALLRRGMNERAAGSVRCERCQRTPLIGERIYDYGGEAILCELCRVLEPRAPVRSRLMHGPAFGHTMRITDSRAA